MTKQGAWTLYEGNSLPVLTSMGSNTIDAVITDPPYNSGGMCPAGSMGQSARQKYVSGDAEHKLPDFDGEARDQRGYLAWMTMLLGESYRVTRRGGPLLVFTDWRMLPITSDALQAAGWAWRGVAVWNKPIARPVRGGFRKSCEYILWGTKGPIDSGANPVYLPGTFTASQPRGKKRKHITQKPVELMRELVRVCRPEGTVLDPFTGSGSTGVAALLEGRRFVGVEMSSTYAKVARERLAEAEASCSDSVGV
ncbi:DNA-methyltransferase [Streptomyces xiamenensis]|uniref:DNA-methyltransferase n=1 Tax=Streptomyces xiamenensis TaxID=408015 RepID=UPI0035D623A1